MNRPDNDDNVREIKDSGATTAASASGIPAWLEPLLSTAFFTTCRAHADAPRSECNLFCLDCRCDREQYNHRGDAASNSFCFYCRSSRHKDHRVIQIRRSSYHDVVRVTEVQKALDISGVQTYVINSARVMFLNERPQPKSKGGAAHLCEICGRSLLDPLRFCSLGCKLVAVKTNGNASFSIMSNDNMSMSNEIAESSVAIETTRSERGHSDGELYPEDYRHRHRRLRGLSSLHHQRRSSTTGPPTTSSSTISPHHHHRPISNARRRKGIPHRAPFKS